MTHRSPHTAKSPRSRLARLGTALLAVASLAASAGCAPHLATTAGASATSDSAPSKNDATLTIFHVNDRHAHMAADPYLAALVKDTPGEVLVFDAGDSLHGEPAASLSEGQTMVDLMNAVGYDAMTPGNHDFNYGSDRLVELSKEMDFPLLAANVTDRATGDLLFDAYHVFQLDDGLEVGVFGLATPETATKTNPSNVKNVEFGDPAIAAKQAVADLKAEGADIIIALTHLGVDEATQPSWRSTYLAENVPGIDVIIDGHSHTTLEQGEEDDGVLIAQTGAMASNIGQIDITVAKDGAVSAEAKLLPIPTEDDPSGPLADVTPDPAIVKVIDKIDDATNELTKQVVGHTPYLLDGERDDVRTSETNLANLITDALRVQTGAPIAFLNGGGIRASIPAGDITMGDVLTTLPFSNDIVTIDVTGQQLLDALEWGVRDYPEPLGGFTQVSGLTFDMDPAAKPLHRVSNVRLADGTKLDPKATYTIATLTYLANGGDDYTMLADHQNLMAYGQDYELFVDYLLTKPEIREHAAGRMTVK